MTFDDLLGRRATLRVIRLAAPGAYVAIDDDSASGDARASLLVPRGELPESVREGDELDVFVYLDSEDRPVASTRMPKLELGEVAFLPVVDVTRVGAFVDWGLPKQLLVPFAEQTSPLRAGDYEPVALFVDRSMRLAATQRIREFLSEPHDLRVGDWVRGEAWRREPGIGVFAIVERKWVGLVPDAEGRALERGQQSEFRVTHVHRDGKFELSLRGLSHEELADDAQHVLAKLSLPGIPPVSDHSSPEQIRKLFGLSKKAFKRAVGRLLKEGAVTLDADGTIVRR
jgi:predicted RNA-binding protein (virulence factor B family)